ncbi:MAG: hypothetical protein AAGF85_00590 [Bacteroidota bacterium]
MDLNFPVSGNNYGGLKLFWFVPIEDVESETTNDVVLKDSKVWFIGRATKFSGDYNERSRSLKYGTKRTLSLDGEMAKLTPELDEVVSQMLGRKYIVVYNDFNGYLKKLGTVEQPLTFEYSGRSGTRPGTKNGISFSYSGVITSSVSYYTGQLPTSEDPTPVDPPVGDPVTIKWNDDTIIAVASPGSTVVIRSEFKASEIVIL